MQAEFETPWCRLILSRYPDEGDRELRAFDAADHYALEQLSAIFTGPGQPARDKRILILNDSFGALALALRESDPVSVGDSWLAQEAARRNAASNQLTPPQLYSDLEAPQQPVDVVLWRLPKTLAYMQDQLGLIRACAGPDTLVLAIGMVKHWSNGHFKVLQQLGEVQLGLAKRKARVVQVKLTQPASGAYQFGLSHYEVAEYGWRLGEYSNVFSRGSLDIGSRVLLQHLQLEEGLRVADLGCGNGVLGLRALGLQPSSALSFHDESFMALASAKHNLQHNLGPQCEAQFSIGDGLQGVEAGSFDLILNNPPFHQQQVVGDFIARRMFRQAAKALAPGGRLWVIGNRHLGYHQSLKQQFRQVRQLAATPKFVLLEAEK